MDKKSDDKIETKSQIQIFLRNNFVFLFLLVPIIIFALRSRSCANNYPFIPKEFFHFELVKKTTGNLEFPLETPSCSYKELIEENRFAYMESNLRSILNETNIQFGGEFIPHNCIPHFSTAIIIPYRNRETQLNAFIPYIHNFLRQQQIHYRIFIVEQADDKPFNRAKLFNIGYTYANELNFPCLVLHDVDLMPMNVGNLYACTQKPRHMSANVDKFRFYLPFTELFGGAVAIQVEHFQAINGVSNLVSLKGFWIFVIRFVFLFFKDLIFRTNFDPETKEETNFDLFLKKKLFFSLVRRLGSGR